jgi:hypothetical protein
MNLENKSANKPDRTTKTPNRKRGWIIGIMVIVVALFVVFGSKLFTKPEVLQQMKSYGKMKHEVTYDKNNISEEEVDYLANGLIEADFFDQAVTKYVYIKKTGSTVELNISSNPLISSNPPAINAFVQLRANLQKQFPNNKIIINLVVYKFDNVIRRIDK